MLSHGDIGTEHILLGLIREGDGVAARALETQGISLARARQQVEDITGRGQQARSGSGPDRDLPAAGPDLRPAQRD